MAELVTRGATSGSYRWRRPGLPSDAPSIVQSGAYHNPLGERQIAQSWIASILPAGQAQLRNLLGLYKDEAASCRFTNIKSPE